MLRRLEARLLKLEREQPPPPLGPADVPAMLTGDMIVRAMSNGLTPGEQKLYDRIVAAGIEAGDPRDVDQAAARCGDLSD